ncbi:putative PPE family protein PPE29 [Mycobacterium marinum]|uniref:PPE family protein n=1 Tax=Mycobacterium marinum TaxID=1781 RepID=UPI000E3E05FF|nr:PPE family protein [Mycobacterium marinum]RFZ21372.1 putative PPE family protein PPE29 [Mycobacterium marinum]
MFYAAFPPEINSGRMYTGPGSGSMLAAAAAWDGLAAELQSTAASYSSVISGLTSGSWVGPSALAMAAAAAPYVTWMYGTAAQATQAAAQATAAAGAYEAAFAAHVPPPVIAANRSQLTALVASNLFGQNTAAIAATEAQYAGMWVQDAIAMDAYAGSSAAASQVTPFSEPPQIVDASGLANQAAAAGQSASTSAGTAAQAILANGPISALLQLGADLADGYTAFATQILNTLFGPSGAETYLTLFEAVDEVSSNLAVLNDEGLLVNLPISQSLKYGQKPAAFGVPPKDALGGGLGLAPNFGRGTLFGAIRPDDVTAHFGRGTLVGKLSVPPSWAAATPDIRAVAAALSAAGPDAVSAAALGQGSLLSSMSMAGMAGAALGAGAPSAVAGNAVKGGRNSLKDLKDRHSPEKLKRLIAQISEKPDSVQHHSVDQAGLDSLLEQLSKKPGVHAVHLSTGKKPKVVPSDAQLG